MRRRLPSAAASRPSRRSRLPWAERAAVAAVFFELGVFAGTWAAALPGLEAGLGLSDGALSLALLSFALASIAATLAAGSVAGRIDGTRMTRIGALAIALSLPLPALAGSLPGLAAAAGTMGFAMGLVDVSMNGQAGAIERRWGSPLMSSFHAAFSLGGLAGAALGGAMAPLGSGAQLGLGAGAALTVAVPALRALRTPAPRAGVPRHDAPGSRAMPRRTLVGLGAVAALCSVVEGAMSDWSAIYLDAVAGSGLAPASAGYAGFSTAMAGARLAGDRAVERLGPGAVLVGGGAVAAAGLTLAVLEPAPVPAALGFALVGLGVGNVTPVVFAAAARSGSSPAAGVAPVATVSYAGVLLGPALVGALSGAVGLRSALGCLAVAAASMAALGCATLGGRAVRA